MNLKLLLASVVLAFSAANAQVNTIQEQDLAMRVASARQEILFAADALLSKSVANKMMEAARVRGARVFLLVSEGQINNQASYMQGLSRRQNILVRTISRVSVTQMIIDKKTLIQGPLVYDNPSPDAGATLISTDARSIMQMSAKFNAIWKQAKPYRHHYPQLQQR